MPTIAILLCPCISVAFMLAAGAGAQLSVEDEALAAGRDTAPVSAARPPDRRHSYEPCSRTSSITRQYCWKLTLSGTEWSEW